MNEELKRVLNEAINVTREQITNNDTMTDIEHKLDNNIVKYVIEKD